MLGLLWNRIKKVASSWNEDNIPRLSAALAYYTIFSITPLLIFSISFVGLFLGVEASRGQIVGYISSTVGYDTGILIQDMIIKASFPKTAKIAQMISVFVLILGVAGIFTELQGGLNTIWSVKAEPEKDWLGFIKKRVFSFIMVLGGAVLLLAYLMSDIGLTLLSNNKALHALFTSEFWILKTNLYSIFSFLIITILFALMFKILPDVTVSWYAIWIGAFGTSLLFTLGKSVLAFYLSHSSVLSIYGASGSFVVLIIWIYYTAQIFFIGAEISKVVSQGEQS